jgi:hypothetical protein
MKSQETNRTSLVAVSLARGLRSQISFGAMVAATLAFHVVDAGGQQSPATTLLPRPAGGAHYAEGELLVKLVGGQAKLQIATSTHAVVGAEVLRTFPAIGWEHVRLPEGMSVSEGIKAYLGLPGVLAVAGTSVLAFRKPDTVGDHSFQDIRMDCSKGRKTHRFGGLRQGSFGLPDGLDPVRDCRRLQRNASFFNGLILRPA